MKKVNQILGTVSLLLLVFLFLLLQVRVGVAQTVLTISNFSFEAPSSIIDYTVNPTGEGWTFSSTNAGIADEAGTTVRVAGGQAADGNQYAFVREGGLLYQPVNFSNLANPGQYTLDFSYAGRVVNGANTISVVLDSVTIGTYTTTSGQSWLTATISITGLASGNHNIGFRGSSSALNQTALVDNVKITTVPSSPIPEPTVVFDICFLIGLVGFYSCFRTIRA